ncbi:MAG: 50S ribosomal protein L23 [Candidatus Magasanikbacteria bacterium CG_4_10_14_0_2_um_filter_37_12]|uniref:Large ribosomal subunit protein uL23 n=1 Tax=Candidatus Magasanikbacteria bacterium CG_4_10_14_0_2_um_filter_37_12 TaxID=1974637 RepID=A0A2M7V8P6_9BACT|nr:MAG: 50S ribosomal protein L23 [Candidatus Magasanikbacteria bacterium CG_4_10_14_0_2_um_filter_37_12]
MGILKKFTTGKKNSPAKEREVLDVEKKISTNDKKVIDKKNIKKNEPTIKKVVPHSNSNAYKVLIRPYVSEKATVAETQGSYTFEVVHDTNKFEIKKAVKEIYGIMPKKVRLMNFEGKRVRFGKKLGRRKDWKKAIVILPKGKTINIHEGV